MLYRQDGRRLSGVIAFISMSEGAGAFAMSHAIRRLLTATMALLPLTACSAAVPFAVNNPSPAKETTSMSAGTPSIQQKLTAEEALWRILELIRTSQSVADFTPALLERVMNVPVASRGKDYGYGEKLTLQWGHGFDVTSVNGRPRFDYQLTPSPPTPPGERSPPLKGLCQVDFDHLTAELEAMGFSRTHHYDDIAAMDGARIAAEAAARGQHFDPGPPPLHFDNFYRPKMGIDVYTEGESHENARHDCVKMLFID
jgi:hypothetical protein